jgi:hypothetical protein
MEPTAEEVAQFIATDAVLTPKKWAELRAWLGPEYRLPLVPWQVECN